MTENVVLRYALLNVQHTVQNAENTIFIHQVDVFNVIFWVFFRFTYVTGTIWDTLRQKTRISHFGAFPLPGGATPPP